MIKDTSLPVLAFTLGDPGGIGPELVLRTLDYFSSGFPFVPVIFGSESILKHSFLEPFCRHRKIIAFNGQTHFEPDAIYFHHSCSLVDFDIKRPTSPNGFASYSYIKEAVKSIQEGHVDALVTAPICKESFQCAGLSFTGHTTLLQHLTGVTNVSMAFHTAQLDVVLATIHVPLNEVSSLLTDSLLKIKVNHAAEFMRKLKKDTIRIAIAGLNPHSGENGLFGDEEMTIIEPFVNGSYFEKDIHVTGPYSADTVFLRAKQGEFDCVIAMYHDQGLIPIKLLGFHEAVNITLGLPFIRTSPDYGTAFDRAYEQLSSIDSMIAATNVACRLAKGE
ncbi:4-hydroxythreonine-4-phosphate dehydrogenase PdxA [Candidatus Marinamargulisbacteria bacterium SCGC AG-343-D04]|nr:4-hydroxythreonine-4-phosphate dehydrogenase PdxA [Candidatus Marinamargulisbacteria bacterium SCGC AG-343-D04]